MRYIGNKENVIPRIDAILRERNITGKKFFDLFSGTTSVARHYKTLGYEVECSDMLYLSYCLQQAYIENNEEPRFDTLLPLLNTQLSNNLFSAPLDLVIDHLNKLPDQEGFIYHNYTPKGTQNLDKPRQYFSNNNGKKIDAIRMCIEEWKEAGLLTKNEYYILLSCLLETVSFYANVAGVYAAFHKKWDPRAVKELHLRSIKLIDNQLNNKAHFADSMELLKQIDTDILYLDPPYNERQYLPNYHILETIARYDAPEIRGITGMRPYENQKSRFCNATTALIDLDRIAATAKYRYLIMSYNSEGIMKNELIVATLSQYGRVEVVQFEYPRFKSHSNGSSQSTRTVNEQLYILYRR